MRTTLFSKFFLGFFVVAVLLAASIFIFSSLLFTRYYERALEENLIELGEIIATDIGVFVKNGDTPSIQNEIDAIKTKLKERVTVINSAGGVLADSQYAPETMESHELRPEIIEALDGRTGVSYRFSPTLQKRMLYVAVPIFEGGAVIGVVRVSVFAQDINTVLAHFRDEFLLSLLLILIVVLVISFFISRGFSRPIVEIEEASKKVATGDFGIRVFSNRTDEIRDLAENFNEMATRLGVLFRELRGNREELLKVISSIEDGIVVLDEDERIKLFNESFDKLTGGQSKTGTFLWEAMREATVSDLIREVRKNSVTGTREAVVKARTYHVSASYVPVERQIVLAFHDITEMKNLAKIKGEFMTNIAHEIKTPLTAITGLIDVIDEVSEEQRRHYLSVIKRNTDRLVEIVRDVSELSMLEEKNLPVAFENVNVKETLQAAILLFEKESEKKGITITTEIKGTPTISGNAAKLEQMFINLLDNAVKYSPRGEISISLAPQGDSVVFSIKDTGIGIPEQDLPRVFERFYRAEKSRSRELGGTGLGLAIVKYIVLLHNGKINIESEEGKGTKVTVQLPKNSR
jgi:two-component system, OmpR family, phosphate regulon sensor histidine kinase PhoR